MVLPKPIKLWDESGCTVFEHTLSFFLLSCTGVQMPVRERGSSTIRRVGGRFGGGDAGGVGGGGTGPHNFLLVNVFFGIVEISVVEQV